jgi:hypothetical protein
VAPTLLQIGTVQVTYSFFWSKIVFHRKVFFLNRSSWELQETKQNEQIKKFVDKKWSQGELLEMHLLESRLLDTIFQNVVCSTVKLSSAQQQNKKNKKNKIGRFGLKNKKKKKVNDLFIGYL